MKFEIGKLYRNNSGGGCRLIADLDTLPTAAGFTPSKRPMVFVNLEFDFAFNTTREGFYYLNGKTSPDNIVSEWKEPHPAESWEVDKLIWVKMDWSPYWHIRFFSHIEGGRIHAFCEGRSSCSRHTETTGWNEAVPYEGKPK